MPWLIETLLEIKINDKFLLLRMACQGFLPARTFRHDSSHVRVDPL